MEKKSEIFDVIVIGAGSGGLNIASFINRVGLKVLLIDRNDRAIGGDCLNSGCVPSKSLIHVARLIRSAKESEKFGMKLSGIADIKKIVEYVKSRQEIFREKENAEYLRKIGIRVVLGEARFESRQKVRVGDMEYVGKKIIIATGSRPRHLELPGIELVEVFNNENIFAIDFLPKKIVIVGAGPIGIEIGQALRVLGSQVTIVGSNFLDKEDPVMVELLKNTLINDGVQLLMGFRPVRINAGKELIVRDMEGREKNLQLDMLFESIGRILNIDKLMLEKAEINLDEKGKIIVDEYLQTTNKDVLVCGDAVGSHMFTHAAELHAKLIIGNFFSPWKKKLNTDAMAWVTYATPEVATFGLDEKILRERGIAYEIIRKDFFHSDYAIVNNNREGKIKIILSKRGIILGGSIVAPNAGEIAQEWMLAQSNRMNINDFMNKIYPYPTSSRISRSLVLEYLSRKLTIKNKKILKWLFH